jgi:hypothetical protein
MHHAPESPDDCGRFLGDCFWTTGLQEESLGRGRQK